MLSVRERDFRDALHLHLKHMSSLFFFGPHFFLGVFFFFLLFLFLSLTLE